MTHHLNDDRDFGALDACRGEEALAATLRAGTTASRVSAEPRDLSRNPTAAPYDLPIPRRPPPSCSLTA